MWRNLKEMDMFHKALWMRNYKQGKVAIWLLWAVSFLALPIVYISAAHQITPRMGHREWRYFYTFDYAVALLPLGGLLILLACTLMGWERTNQGMDLIFALPFKRKDIFLSKWMLGAANITGITIVNLILMFFIQQTTIHGAHQTFIPFLIFFLFMFISLLAVYSLALLMGTITGGFISQAFLTVGVCILPWLLIGLFEDLLIRHNVSLFSIVGNLDFAVDISMYSVILPNFHFEQRIRNGYGWVVLHQNLPSLTTWITLLIYLITSTYFGMKLYKQTPSENNGKIILYKDLEPIFLWLVVACVSLFVGVIGSNVFWNASLITYYISAIISGTICYITLSKLMQKPIRFKRNI